MILVARPELVDALYGSTILVVAPMGGKQQTSEGVPITKGASLGLVWPLAKFPVRRATVVFVG